MVIGRFLFRWGSPFLRQGRFSRFYGLFTAFLLRLGTGRALTPAGPLDVIQGRCCGLKISPFSRPQDYLTLLSQWPNTPFDHRCGRQRISGIISAVCVCPSICLSSFFHVHSCVSRLTLYLSDCVSVCLSVCLSVFQSVRISICPSSSRTTFIDRISFSRSASYAIYLIYAFACPCEWDLPPPSHFHVLPGLFTASTYFYIQNYLHSSDIIQPITCLYLIVCRIG